MTTPRDLLIVAMDVAMDREPRHPVGQGDLSLALAGAELIDLLKAGAIRLDDDHIVPLHRPAPADPLADPLMDPLMDRAASSLVEQAPYEPVADWLWRRGRDLTTAYLTALEGEGELTRRHHRWAPFRTSQTVLADSPARRRAADRWTAQEPVLTALATAAGIGDTPTETEDSPGVADDAVATVLAAVNDAVRELEAVRQRRAIEEAAFDNLWRGNGI
jgi:hypothetical protein